MSRREAARRRNNANDPPAFLHSSAELLTRLRRIRGVRDYPLRRRTVRPLLARAAVSGGADARGDPVNRRGASLLAGGVASALLSSPGCKPQAPRDRKVLRGRTRWRGSGRLVGRAIVGRGGAIVGRGGAIVGRGGAMIGAGGGGRRGRWGRWDSAGGAVGCRGCAGLRCEGVSGGRAMPVSPCNRLE